MLRDALSWNPFYCVECNGEVLPKRIGLTAELAESVSSWRAIHSSLYRLWLASGDYEDWAREQLLDPQGQVNEDAFEILEQVNELPGVTFYYWFFRDVENDDEPATHCPKCSEALWDYGERFFGKCDYCMILI